MKKFSFFALCAMIATAMTFTSCEPGSGDKNTTDSGERMLVGNCTNTLGSGFGNADIEGVYKAATPIDASKFSAKGSTKIEALRVGIINPFTDGKVWIATSYDATEYLAEAELTYDESGWSYAVFAEAFEIPADTKLWLGYTVSTNGYALAMSGNSTPKCYYSIGSGEWSSLKDIPNIKGAFCIQAVCSGGDYSTLRQGDLALLKVNAPSSVAGDEQFSVDAYIASLGVKSIGKFTVKATVGGKTYTQDVTTDMLIGKSHKVSFSGIDAPSTPYVPNGITVTVEGEGDDLASNNEASGFISVSKGSFDRNMLLIEQFTTERCGYCPGGAKVLAEAIAGMQDPNKVSWVAHHAGFGTDFLTIDENTTIASYLGVRGAPNCAMDRIARAINGGIMMVFHPAYSTTEMLESFSSGKTAATVEIERTFANDTLTIVVTGESEEPNIKLSALLVQSNIPEQNQSGGGGNYIHNNAVRYMFTPALGDTLTLDADGKFSKTYKYAIGAQINAVDAVVEDLEVVAYVAINGTGAKDSPVLNCDRVAVTEVAPTGVPYINYANTTIGTPEYVICK